MLTWPSSSRGRGALVAALLALQTVPAFADRDPRTGAPVPPEREKKDIPSPITDRFYIEGIFYPALVSSSIRLDPSRAVPGVVGTELNGERDLGLLNRIYQARLELMFRLRTRSRLRVDFQDVSRSASHVLSRDILFGEQDFLAGSLVDSALSWRIFTIAYTYSVFRNDWLEVGVGLAANLIEAQAHLEVSAMSQRQDVSTADAYPTIPVDFAWRFARRFALTGRVEYFSASVNNFSGTFTSVHSDVQYRWTPNFSLGVGYTLQRIAVTMHSGSFPGVFDTDVKGAEAFLRVSF